MDSPSQTDVTLDELSGDLRHTSKLAGLVVGVEGESSNVYKSLKPATHINTDTDLIYKDNICGGFCQSIA